MRSRFVGLFVALLVLCASLVGAAAPVAAGAPPVPGVGGAICPVHSGKVSFKPKLTAAPQANVVAKFSLTFKPCTGETGLAAATLTGATLKAVSAPYTASCTTPQPPALTATVAWKAKKAKLATSTIAWSTSGGDANHLAFAPLAAITGSYAADTAALSLVRLKSADCSKGIASWNVTPGSLLTLEAPCSTYGPADAFGTATGANGDRWLVVVPSQPYPARCHPTDTMSYAWNNSACNNAANVALEDAGAKAATTSGPVTNESDFWGIDTGLAAAVADTCGGFAARTYSGDGIYAPLSELPPCGTNVATTLGTAGDSSSFANDIWLVIVPSVPFADTCHPTGTLSASVTTAMCGIISFPSATLQDSGFKTAFKITTSTNVQNPTADYWGRDSGITFGNSSICGAGVIHATYSGDADYAGFST